jgi:integrase
MAGTTCKGTEETGKKVMGTYKRGGVYWYKFMWAGKLVRESTKQGSDKVARQMEAAHRTSLAKGEVGIREKKAAPTFSEFCDKRIEPYAKPRSSWLWYRAGIRALKKYAPLAGAPLDKIRGEMAAGFAAWRQAQGLEPCSINSSLRVLRRILRLAADWGELDAAPKIQLLSGETRRERVITSDEEVRYLAATTPLLSEVATLLFDTGMRPDELHRMRWEDITWGGIRHGTILVTSGKTKAARRPIPMTPRVHVVLDGRWKKHGSPEIGWVWPAATKTGHIDHSTVRKPHRNALKVSKVRAFVLYSLRHTFLTRLGASGCDVWTLMRIAGHSSISISSRYVHPSDATVLDAVERLGRHKIGHNQENRESEGANENTVSTTQIESYMVSADGLEPSTHALKGHCSAS